MTKKNFLLKKRKLKLKFKLPEGPLNPYNLRPNRVKSQFLVKEPHTVLGIDFSKVKNVKLGSEVVNLTLFVCVDMCTGKVLTHFLERRPSAENVFLVLNSLLLELEELYGEPSTATIIHSDRGKEFRAHAYQKLELWHPQVQLSMNNYATPTDNAVTERVFRTFKGLKPLWFAATKADYRQPFSSLDDAKNKWARFLDVFNEKHPSERNAGLGANRFEKLLLLERNRPDYLQLTTDFDMASTKRGLPFNEPALQQVRNYRQNAVDRFYLLPEEERNKLLQQTFVPSLQLQLKQLQTSVQAIAQNQTLLAQGLPGLFEEQTETLINALGPKPKRRKRKSRPPRSPLTFVMQQLMHKRAVSPEASIYDLRNTLAVLVLSATGCRISEIRCLTLDNLQVLTTTRELRVHVAKRRTAHSIDTKVISNDHAYLLSEVLRTLQAKLQVIEFPLKENSFIFVDYNKKDNVPLTLKYFTDTVNRLLKDYSIQFNKLFGSQNYLTSHSPRVNYATELFGAGYDVSQVQQSLGHKDVRSTLLYNRYVLDEQKRKDMLDSVHRQKIEEKKQEENET
jgi:site-specific recombinase XerD/transposase InsO family protein